MRAKTSFSCQACGHQSPRWLGRCPDCGGWNTMKEERQAATGKGRPAAMKTAQPKATPIADMKLLYGFTRGDHVRFLRTALPMRRIRKDMLWCDQPDNPNYNRLVKAPFRPSHEEMRRGDGLYDICLVLDWNVSSRRRHRGSAIFFHLIRPGYEPTAGCIAISLSDFRRILPLLRKGTTVRVV